MQKTAQNNDQAKTLEFLFPPKVRLDVFLHKKLLQFHSRSYLQKLIRAGAVTKKGETLRRPSYTCKTEESIVIEIPEEKPFSLKSADVKIDIIYEDDFLAVVHKPAGMTVHPGAGTSNDTLVHALVGNMNLSDGSEAERPGIVHRLDRDTEGVLIIAKTNRAHALLANAFHERKIKKIYHAWVWGSLLGEAELNGFIERSKSNRKLMTFAKEASSTYAKESRLSYKCLFTSEHFSEVEIELITGRTHQIRASFKSLGYPVIGDSLYGKDSSAINRLPARLRSVIPILKQGGLMLVARQISFSHPITQEPMTFVIKENLRFDHLKEILNLHCI